MNKLILHKINHKPLLIEKIFPYTIDRPLIFLILLKHDLSLKESLKFAFKSLKKNNNCDDEVNKTFERFISYRLIFEKNLYEKYLINLYSILYSLRYHSHSNFFKEYFFEIIDANMKKNKILKEKAVDNFILDFFQYHKKFCLYIFHDNNSTLELLKKLKYIEFDIDLIFFINDKSSGIDDNIKSELINLNIKVNNIYFAFVWRKRLGNEIIFQQIKEYIDIINKMKNKKHIKKLSLKHLESKEDILINYLYENNLYINLEKLEKVEYDEDAYLTIYQKFIFRYNLSSIFSKKIFFNLIIITPEEFNDIKTINEEKKKYLIKKLNFVKNCDKNNTDLKIMFFDFQNNSPYQENFIYFSEKYLSDISDINTIVIHNIGTANYNIDCKKNIKKPLIHINLLKNIIYENKIINNGNIWDEIKEFIDLFFYTENLLYKVNTKNFLIYSNELQIFDILNKFNPVFSYEINNLKIYFDNIIYEIYNKKELNIKKCEDIDTNINFANIIKTVKQLKKDFKMDLKGEADIINQINSYKLDSNLLTDKIQKGIAIKELGTLRTIFKPKKIFRGNINFKKIRKKLFNKKNVYKLAIFKTIESDIFGFCFKGNKKAGVYDYNFLFTSNTDIFNSVLDDDMFVKDESLFIKEYITENELLMIKEYVIAKKQFVDDIINYAEIYYLQKII